jgi:hypothetical protein
MWLADILQRNANQMQDVQENSSAITTYADRNVSGTSSAWTRRGVRMDPVNQSVILTATVDLRKCVQIDCVYSDAAVIAPAQARNRVSTNDVKILVEITTLVAAVLLAVWSGTVHNVHVLLERLEHHQSAVPNLLDDVEPLEDVLAARPANLESAQNVVMRMMTAPVDRNATTTNVTHSAPQIHHVHQVSCVMTPVA